MFYSGGKSSDSPPPSYQDIQNNSANGSSKQSSKLQNSSVAAKDKDLNGAASGEASKQNDDSLDYPLHECVFRGDVKQLSALIRAGHDLGKIDSHGNSALHLAVMLGRRECVHLLCAHGAPVKIKNKQGWSPIAEAIR